MRKVFQLIKQKGTKYYKYLFGCLVIIILVISGVIVNGKSEPKIENKINMNSYNMVSVYIYGEVKYPGFYTTSSSSTVFDVILQANGLTEQAETSLINMNKLIEEGEKIYIPKNESEINKNNKININTASLDQLMTLKGIGKEKASSIILYRITNGPFNSVNDLLSVPGISKTILMDIINEIKLS